MNFFSTFFKFTSNDFNRGDLIVESDRHKIFLLEVILFDTFNFLQDSPYPVFISSGVATRYVQLRNSLFGQRFATERCQKKHH